MHRNPETLTTFFSSGMKRLLTFLLLGFSTRGERETQFLLCWLFLHRPQSTPQLNCLGQSPISTNWPNKRAAHPVAPSWTALAQVQISTNCFFQKSPKIPAHRFRAMTSFTPQSHFPSWVLLWHLWLSHLPHASVNTCSKSRTVQNLTKPNDKI